MSETKKLCFLCGGETVGPHCRLLDDPNTPKRFGDLAVGEKFAKVTGRRGIRALHYGRRIPRRMRKEGENEAIDLYTGASVSLSHSDKVVRIALGPGEWNERF